MDGELQWGGNAEERGKRNVWEEVKTKGWAEDKQAFQGGGKCKNKVGLTFYSSISNLQILSPFLSRYLSY